MIMRNSPHSSWRSALCLFLAFPFSQIVQAGLIAPESYKSHQNVAGYSSVQAAMSASQDYWDSVPGRAGYLGCRTWSPISYDAYQGRWTSLLGGCASGGANVYAVCPAGSTLDKPSGKCFVPTCPPGTTEDPETRNCVKDCSSTTGNPEMHVFQVTSRASVNDPFPDPSTYQVTVPPAICSESCRYTNQSNASLTCGSLNGSDGLGLFCIHSFTGTGDQCQAGDTPGKNSGDFGGPTPVPPTDPDDPTDPANTCQAVPGYVWTGTTCAKLFEEDPDTGGGDDGGGDGGNDGGGNDGGGDTGGGDNGGGDTGGGDTGGGDTGGGGSGCGGGSCPNESTEYDGSAEWSDGEATALGGSTGETVSESLTGAVDEALEGREQEIEDALGELPDKVEGWFSDLPGLSFMDNLFVPASGCSELVIPIELGQYNFSMPIDFCVLSSFKTLLEWVIWCLTAIAVWNVYYSGLRLQNASASRGGF